jgi:hypothetical protein
MKNKQLPYIAFEGVGKTKEEVLDSLIAIEPLLVMVGYDDNTNKGFNNHQCENSELTITHLIPSKPGRKNVCYFSHNGCGNPIRFKATEIKQFINYMIKEGYLK